MRGHEAETTARYWYGYAVSMAKAPPPLYGREDWRAEALLGLAKAVRDLAPGAPRPVQEAYVRRAVGTHLAKARKAVNRPASYGGHGSAGDPPRATLAGSASMDETVSVNGVEWSRHDLVPAPLADVAHESAVGRAILDAIRDLRLYLNVTEAQAIGFLLRGLEVDEVAALTGRTVQAETDRRYQARKLLRYALAQRGVLGSVDEAG